MIAILQFKGLSISRVKTAMGARSINYQMGIAKLPLAKELAYLELDSTPINAELIEQLAGGDFLDSQRNVVLIGGTGTGKSHVSIACRTRGREGKSMVVRFRRRRCDRGSGSVSGMLETEPFAILLCGSRFAGIDQALRAASVSTT